MPTLQREDLWKAGLALFSLVNAFLWISYPSAAVHYFGFAWAGAFVLTTIELFVQISRRRGPTSPK